MKEVLASHNRGAWCLWASAATFLLASQATAADPIVVVPGDTLSFPTPIINATIDGAPGGDTITGMQLVVIGNSALVKNPIPSATQSLAPGEEKIFSPSFFVGNVLDGTYTVTLHMVTPDDGIIPDPDSAESDTIVIFGGGAVRSADEPFSVAVLKSPIEKPVNFPSSRSNTFLPQGEESSRGGQAQLPPTRGERARSRGADLPLGPHAVVTQATSAARTQAPTPCARGGAAAVSWVRSPAAPHARPLPGHARARRVARRWPLPFGPFVTARAPQARNPLGPRRPAGSAAALFIRSAAGTEEVFHSPSPRPNDGPDFVGTREALMTPLSTLSTVSTAKAEDGWVGKGADGGPPWPLGRGVLQRKRSLGAGKKKPLRGWGWTPVLPLSVSPEP